MTHNKEAHLQIKIKDRINGAQLIIIDFIILTYSLIHLNKSIVNK